MNTPQSNDSKAVSDDSTKPQQQRNDNSNPQQGTVASKGVTTSSTSAAATSSTSPPPADTFPIQRPTMKIPPSKKDSRKLFVGGLPSDVTSDEFRLFFEQFGEVLDSVVMLDRLNGRSRGFGFVTYVDPNVSHRLLRMGNDSESASDHPLVGRLEMRGKMVEVKSAEPKEYSNGPRRFHQNRTPHPLMYRNPGAPVHYGDPNVMMYGAPMDYAYPHQPYFSPFVTGYMAHPMVYDPTFPGAPGVPVYHPNAAVPQPPPPAAAEVAQGVPAMVPGHPGEGMAQHPPAIVVPQEFSGVPQFAQHHNYAHPAPYQQGSTMHPAAPGLPVSKDTQTNEPS